MRESISPRKRKPCPRACGRYACLLWISLGTVNLTVEANDDGPRIGPSSARHPNIVRRLRKKTELNELLNFAIIGFPKTGTSFMEHYLLRTDETRLDNTEHCFADANEMYDLLVNGRHYGTGGRTEEGLKIMNGVKCPKELYGRNGLSNYETYVPEIKFIISTRHPVLWFQSFYNYRLRQTYKHTNKETIWNPKTTDLIGPCRTESPYHYHDSPGNDKKSVCTDGAKFHHALSRLGKTPMISEEEKKLLQHEMLTYSFPKAKVFLMEIGQLDVHNRTRADLFIRDLQKFLGLEHALPPLIPHESKVRDEEVQNHVIDICDKEHDLVRSVLVEIGKEAAEWIRSYFLKSPDVIVSSMEHFLWLIDMWKFDPCESDFNT